MTADTTLCPDCRQPVAPASERAERFFDVDPAPDSCGCADLHEGGEAKLGLNWSHPCHWSGAPEPCVYCARLTNLLDGAGIPAHKVCAERAVTRWREQETRC